MSIGEKKTVAVALFGASLALALIVPGLAQAAARTDSMVSGLQQDTAYAPPPTSTTSAGQGYAPPPSNTPQPTLTQSQLGLTPSVTLAPGLLPTTVATSAAATGAVTGTQLSDYFLTENAQMGLSSATPGPSPTPTATSTSTVTPTPLPSPVPPYHMNWGAFSLGFFGVILLPVVGYAGYRFYQRRKNQSPLL
jgi:hypothetical protein